MRKDIAVVGHFGFGENLLNGQTIKTKIVTSELEKEFGPAQVRKIDTHGGAKAFPKILWNIFKSFFLCGDILLFPAHNGVRIFVPVCSFLNLFFRRRLHYIVIGGWLPELLKKNHRLAKCLRKFRGIYVETNTLKTALTELSLDNVYVMPNFKSLSILEPSELTYIDRPVFPLCTFSRVTEGKGIEDAVAAVMAANAQLGKTVFSLDIFGPIDGDFRDTFSALQKSFPAYIVYRGEVPYDKSVETLRSFFALLFPTRFYTEGIPGTVIDAYAAGVPVIASRWESFSDVVEDGQTGIGYAFGDREALVSVLLSVAAEPERINDLKTACLQKARAFCPEEAMVSLLQQME